MPFYVFIVSIGKYLVYNYRFKVFFFFTFLKFSCQRFYSSTNIYKKARENKIEFSAGTHCKQNNTTLKA